jgi:peptidyl-prolyl cis-trans isomerase D
MFGFVEKHKKVIQIFLGLIAITFMTWGIESYTRQKGGADAVATVNGLTISQREFDEELRRQQDQLRRMFGRNFDPAILDTPDSRRTLLESMISQRLIASEAGKANLAVSDEMLADLIHSVPAFQSEGKFSKAQYELALRSQNPPKSPAQFESSVRYDMALQQLGRAVADTAIAPRAVSDRLGALEAQKREVSEVRIPAQQFMSQVKLDDDKLKAYYDAHAEEFRTPERVRAEYALLSAEALANQEQVAPEELRALWDNTYSAKLRDKEGAREKARSVLAAVRKNPAGFAEIAKRESQDTGSAASGGDLGFSARGGLVKPVEDAVFRMKEGEISNIVESQYGFHIIRLTGIKGRGAAEERRASHILIAAPTDVKPFEEMRGQLEAEAKKQRAARRFAESTEAFSNLAYEQPDSLKPAADRFKLQIRTTSWITKSANQELGPLDNPKLLAALFSPDSIKNKRNTDAIEVAPGTLVAARVVEHQPAAQRGFDEVKAEIADKLRKQQAAELAQKDGAAKLEQLRKGADLGLKWGAPRVVSRRDAQGMPSDLLRPVVAADVSKLPAYVGTPMADAGYLLLRISKVIEAEPKERGADVEARAGQLFGASQYDAYLDSLRSRADIQIKKENLEKK